MMLMLILAALAVVLVVVSVVQVVRGRDRAAFRAMCVLLVIVGAMVAVGCGDHVTNVNVDTNTNQQNQTAPTPSPSASPSASGPVASVTIQGFGQVCPVGVAPAPGQREVRVGCNLDVTVNPRNASGQVIFDTGVTGGAPDSFRQESGASSASFTVSAQNPYNANLVGLAAGSTLLKACVRGVCSDPQTVGGGPFNVVP